MGIRIFLNYISFLILNSLYLSIVWDSVAYRQLGMEYTDN